MKIFDILSFAFGGLLFGLASIVVTIQFLENNKIPGYIVNVLTISLLILCVIGCLYVAFIHRLIFKKLKVRLKSFPEVIDDLFHGLDQSTMEELKTRKLEGAESRIKQVAAWYAAAQARLSIGRTAVAIVGGIALFFSAKILIAQLAEMQMQTSGLNQQLEALIEQNKKFEEQLTHEKEVDKTQRTTELVKLLYDAKNDKAVKSMALIELSKLGSGHLVLSNANLEGIIAPELVLTNKDMPGINLKKSVIQGAVLTKSRLLKADISDADLTSSILTGTILSQSDLNRTTFESTFAIKSNLKGANFTNATFGHSTFTGSNFNSLNFNKSSVPLCKVKGRVALKTSSDIKTGAIEGESEQIVTSMRNITSFHDRFNFTQIHGTDFTRAKLSGTRFIKAYGEYPNFSSSQMENVTFKEAQIEGAVFDGINAVNVNFSDANLTYSTWRNAELSRVNFSRAILTCADFSGMKSHFKDENNIAFSVAGADLRSSQGLTEKILETACGDKNTKLPLSLRNVKLKQCNKDWDSSKLKNYDNLDLYLAGDQHENKQLLKLAFELMEENNRAYPKK